MDVTAPAKINLHLRVGPPRADGFHPLLTWMATIGLSDKITFAHNPDRGEIHMTCSDSSLPCDDRNLVVRAAKLLRGHRAESQSQSVAIHLQKNIPHGGGLGGGSSDAAFTLTGLNRFWNLRKTGEELAAMAAELGSDIPFFLYGPSSICRGRGEWVRPTPPPRRAKWVLLILPAMSMPTPAVYRQFDKTHSGRIADVDQEPNWQSWSQLPATDLLEKLVNDLEPPAFAIEPRLATVRQELEKNLDRPIRMSGSGSSLFSLYDTATDAEAAAEKLGHRRELRAVATELAPLAVV
jgi:4-diphosphocytidyl-2-C-methyl-D-erythritol kinase